jgi:hypothetical protein
LLSAVGCRLARARRIKNWSLTSVPQWLVKTGGLLAESIYTEACLD